MRAAGHAWAALWYASVLLLTGAVGLLVGSWRIFSPSDEADRSLKFLRAAYLWLFLSLGMLVLLPGLPVCRAAVLGPGQHGGANRLLARLLRRNSPRHHRRLHQPHDRRCRRQGGSDAERGRCARSVRPLAAVCVDQHRVCFAGQYSGPNGLHYRLVLGYGIQRALGGRQGWPSGEPTFG